MRGAAVAGDAVFVSTSRYGLHADEFQRRCLGEVIWAVQRNTVEFHPWNSRALTPSGPTSGGSDSIRCCNCTIATVRDVARVVYEVPDELGAVTGWPEDVRWQAGLHVYVRIEPSFGFHEVRAAAPAFAGRSNVRRGHGHDDMVAQGLRSGGGARRLQLERADHTIAAAFSVRGVPDATVPTSITWAEVDVVESNDCTIATVPLAIRGTSVICTPTSIERCSRSTHRPTGPPATSAPVSSTRSRRRSRMIRELSQTGELVKRRVVRVLGEWRGLHGHPSVQRQRLQDGLHLAGVSGSP